MFRLKSHAEGLAKSKSPMTQITNEVQLIVHLPPQNGRTQNKNSESLQNSYAEESEYDDYEYIKINSMQLEVSDNPSPFLIDRDTDRDIEREIEILSNIVNSQQTLEIELKSNYLDNRAESDESGSSATERGYYLIDADFVETWKEFIKHLNHKKIPSNTIRNSSLHKWLKTNGKIEHMKDFYIVKNDSTWSDVRLKLTFDIQIV